jgi:hypothetical protein
MHRHFEKLQREIASAVEGRTPEQLRTHAPGKWSAAEVLEHLYLTYTGTIKGFERVAAGQHIPAKPTWRDHARRLLVVGLGHMPAGREAPANTRPRGLPPENIVAEIGVKIAEMDEVIARCERNLGHGRLLDHPVLGPLTAEQWRKFHLVHGLHHAKQIRRMCGSF